MKRFIALSVATAAVVIFTTTAGARSTMTHPKLLGAVGKNDAFVITLKTANGKLVKSIPAGTYTFVIHDFSSLHSFNMDGPHGWSHDFTTVPGVTTKTVTLKLKAGKYKYYCVAHEATMFHFFTVK
jgi:plastocyanin